MNRILSKKNTRNAFILIVLAYRVLSLKLDETIHTNPAFLNIKDKTEY